MDHISIWLKVWKVANGQSSTNSIPLITINNIFSRATWQHTPFHGSHVTGHNINTSSNRKPNFMWRSCNHEICPMGWLDGSAPISPRECARWKGCHPMWNPPPPTSPPKAASHYIPVTKAEMCGNCTCHNYNQSVEATLLRSPWTQTFSN